MASSHTQTGKWALSRPGAAFLATCSMPFRSKEKTSTRQGEARRRGHWKEEKGGGEAGEERGKSTAGARLCALLVAQKRAPGLTILPPLCSGESGKQALDSCTLGKEVKALAAGSQKT